MHFGQLCCGPRFHTISKGPEDTRVPGYGCHTFNKGPAKATGPGVTLPYTHTRTQALNCWWIVLYRSRSHASDFKVELAVEMLGPGPTFKKTLAAAAQGAVLCIASLAVHLLLSRPPAVPPPTCLQGIASTDRLPGRRAMRVGPQSTRNPTPNNQSFWRVDPSTSDTWVSKGGPMQQVSPGSGARYGGHATFEG